MSRVVNFYDTFAGLYPILDVFLKEPKRQFLSRINREPSGSLLEIGVGRGDNLPLYTHRPLTGIDMSEGMLAYARKKAPEYCELFIMDAARLEFAENAFDYCVISHVLTVVDNPGQVMNEVHRVVVPGGKIFVLNHESTGPAQALIGKIIAPLVSRILHFSATFDLEALVNPGQFTILDKGLYGFLPKITMMVLENKAGEQKSSVIGAPL